MISRQTWLSASCLLACLTSIPTVAVAELKLASIFGDSMVLQRDLPVPVWGWAEPNEAITVTFAGQTKTATADAEGKWQVKLDALKANSEGSVLSVVGADRIEIKDVLVGEVWICSGQSNMEWGLGGSTNGPQEVAQSQHDQIRLYDVVGHLVSPTPLESNPGQWKVSGPSTAGGFSAVGYFFGRRLHKELNVPIGLVGSNWGGTRIEPWISPAALKNSPELKAESMRVQGYTKETPVQAGFPSAIFNAMINPLAPFAMRGAIWYQGESNGNEGESYYHKKKALVSGWRELFNPNLAFYWVQLANWKEANDNPAGGDGWAKLREAQLNALDIEHTGMAVTIDIGEANDIHPRNKQDVGARLAQWALHQTYGKTDLVPSGPIYKGHKVVDGAIRIQFDHVGGGLMVGQKTGLEPTAEVADGKLARFAIAGEDQQWHWATATIDGDTVVVKSQDVPNPVAVRYAFSMNPEGANLYNKEGLPASPFRTDQ
ncbi:MAG: sialate O-acetylesterase [Pirellulaceae bacterium]